VPRDELEHRRLVVGDEDDGCRERRDHEADCNREIGK
jgi:hypothetical protein